MIALPPSILPLFAIVLTLGTYLLGVEAQKRLRNNPFANPVLIAIVLIGTTLHLLHLSYKDYFTGAQLIHFLLGPATVALAIPMVRALEHIRRGLWPMLFALLAGSLTGLLSGYAIVRLLGGSQAIALSMAPKSLTTPIAIAVSSAIGGLPSLSAVLAILGGILVAISIDPILHLLHITEPSARGLAAGTAGSGIGASRVIPQHTLSAAFAGIAIGANGILTAILAPIVLPLLKHW
jgi:putative effector of murein hydrolase